MARIFIGNIKGLKGDKGDTGEQGLKGEKGDPGTGGGGGTASEVIFYTEPQYYTVVGREFNIYWDNISTVINPDNIVFTASTTTPLTITNFDECMRVTATVGMIGSRAVTVVAKDRFTDAVIATTSFTLNVLANDALDKVVKAIFIGDSLTQGDYIQRTVKELAGANFTLYGTRGTSPYNHEGRTSWSAVHYLNNSTYNTLTNPFYNAALGTSSKFDFSYYISTNPTYADVNLVNIFLGRNASYDLAEVDRVKNMVDSIRAYSATIVITLTMAYHAGDKTLKTKDLYNTKTKRLITYNYNAKLKEVFGSYSKLYIIPQFINLDNFYDHGPTEVSKSARNTAYKELINNDTIHFSTYGSQKLGDTYYGYFKSFVNEINSAPPLSVTGIALDKPTLTFNSVSTQTLIATLTPVGSTGSVTWTTSNATIATVSNGVVTSKANGSCIITATCDSYSATCDVTVSDIETSSFTLPNYNTVTYPNYLVEKDDTGKYYLLLTGVRMTKREWNTGSSLRYYTSSLSNNYKDQYQTSPDGVTWTIVKTGEYASNSQLTGAPRNAIIYQANYSVDTYVYNG